MVSHPVEQRISHIKNAEFGERWEVVFRLTVLVLASVMLSIFADQRVVLIWLGAVLACYGALVFCLTRSAPWNRRVGHFRLCLALYALLQLVFIFAPLYLIQSGEPALVFSGSLALVTVLLCKLQHAQDDPAIAGANALQFGVSVLAMLGVVLPAEDDPFLIALCLGAAVTVVAYYGMTIRGQLSQQSALNQSRLRYAQSQKARALTQFVGGVAHDFNNILTAIMGNLEFARVLPDKADRDQALVDAGLAAERAAMTVRQLLASSGRARLRPETIAAADLHSQIEPVLQDLLEPGITLKSAARDPEFTAFADRDMLETSLIQLYLNAQDALKGGGNIWLVSRTSFDVPEIDPQPDIPPPYLAVTLSDDGPGADADSLDMLAEPFFTTKAVGQGPGLGLSAVQGFARQSGGCLILENRPGGGFSATILLPRA